MHQALRLIFLTALFLSHISISAQSQSDYYPFNHIDVIEYKIEVDLTESFEQKNNSLKGFVNIICMVDTSTIDKIYLDAVALIIDSVIVDGGKSDFNSTENYLIVLLKGNYLFGDTLNLEIFYKRPAQDTPGYYFRIGTQFGINEGVAYTASWQTNTRYWLPCKDWPTDKALVKIKIKVPKDIIAVSNGKFLERIDDNDYSIFVWSDNHPMATYVISFSASEYISVEMNIPRFSNSIDSIKIGYYTSQSNISQMTELHDDVSQIIRYYSGKFVEFPFNNLSFVAPGTRFSGMSNQTLIQFNHIPIVGSSFNQYLLAHEIAHQWFGSYVNSADWNLWLTEGLADYAALLYLDFINDNNFFYNRMKESIESILQSDTLSINDGVYGSLFPVLEILRTTVGDSLYWNSFENFLKTNGYKSAAIKEFNEAFNLSTGKNYDWFFDNWFYNPGHPIYIISWELEKIFDYYYVFLKIAQIQTSQNVFTMPVDITFITENGDTVINVVNKERVQFYEFRFNSKPLDVIFDKDTLLFLKEVNYELGNVNPKYSYLLNQNFPNPFNPVTKIEYRIENRGHVSLIIYDILGRETAALVNEEKQPGIYEVEFDGSNLSSGIYFYQIKSGNFIQTNKMLLMK